MTVVEDDQKAPFYRDTAPWCREGRYSFSWVAPLYPYIAEGQAKRYQVPFLEPFVWHDLGLNPNLPDQFANALPTTIVKINVICIMWEKKWVRESVTYILRALFWEIFWTTWMSISFWYLWSELRVGGVRGDYNCSRMKVFLLFMDPDYFMLSLCILK